MTIIVKRKGHKEVFDEKKTYASVYAACISAQYNERKCENIADKITKKIERFVTSKKTIKSTEIRKAINQELIKMDKELAFFYEQHLPNLKHL